jgi:ribose 5-phosphate isomerase A
MAQVNSELAAKMKETAAAAACALVKPGMKLGLGTGSTALYAIRTVGRLLKEGELRDISVFATSFQTEMECERLNIPFYPLNSDRLAPGLDLTIDGADEVDANNYLIKGGGAALLMEKLAAYASLSYAIIVDETKAVNHLGLAFPVPVEVIPEARVQVTKALAQYGKVNLREGVRKAGPVITEHGNIILDVLFTSPVDSKVLECEFNMITGVVENGFFTRKRPIVFIAHSAGTLEVKK